MAGPTEDPNGFDAFEELQVSPRACDEVIRAAYGRLARMNRADPESKQRLDSAFMVLTDPRMRRELRMKATRPNASMRPMYSGLPFIFALSAMSAGLAAYEVLRAFAVDLPQLPFF